MESVKNISYKTPWTWADQISTYRFWGLFFFFIFMSIASFLIINSYFALFRFFGHSESSLNLLFRIRSFSMIGGLFLAWILAEMKNHYLLYLFSFLMMLGLLIQFLSKSLGSFITGSILEGLVFGAIMLGVPAIISGGRGKSEMFVVSFGLIFFYLTLNRSLSGGMTLNSLLSEPFQKPTYSIHMIALGYVIIGTLFLIPVRSTLFNDDPPKREFGLTPKQRNPWVVFLLFLVPLYNIYHLVYLSYRFHGEVNTISQSQNILSPRAAAWCTAILPIWIVLCPVILASLNGSLITKFQAEGKTGFYRNWAIILWAFLCVPISSALIQSNMNKFINKEAS